MFAFCSGINVLNTRRSQSHIHYETGALWAVKSMYVIRQPDFCCG